jgi:lipid II:glycine glycyltransferase (peptidoglycan interpeptide bridge formation enzyme)
MNVSIVRRLPEEQWRSFVQAHSHGNIFHTPEMFEVFKRTKGHHPALWAATRHGQILALLLPVNITLMGGLLRPLTTRSVVYGSVLCAEGSAGQEALRVLLRTYVQEMNGASLFTELRNLSDLEDSQPVLIERGFAYDDHLNYLIDLAPSPEEVLQSLGRRTRKHIRRGLRQGDVHVEVMTEREGVSRCYDLLARTYNSAEIPLADLSLFEAAFDLLSPKGMIRFTVARVEDAIAAVSVELLYKDIVYGWYGGLDREYGSYMPNEMLMWNILEWGAQHGYKIYDFGGAGHPDEEYGVRDFKAKFGGKLVCFGRNIYVHSPLLLKLSTGGYELYRRFFLSN